MEFFENVSGPCRIAIKRVIAGENCLGFSHGGEAKHADQYLDVREILKLFAEPKREALHREQVFGVRDVYAEMTQILEHVEPPALAEESLDSVAQPVSG